jgi:predicted dehydrogenase
MTPNNGVQLRRFSRANADDTPLGVAVVGYGYWGPNLARNVMERPETKLVALCDSEPMRRAAFSARIPSVPTVENLDEVLHDPSVDALVVATPPHTHYDIVRRALNAGKHVLVEKPLATTTDHARELIDIADEQGLVLMPGHTFVYSPAVEKVRQLIADGVLGEIYFVTSSRMNLGKYQSGGVILDLAPHDLSILLYLLGDRIVSVAASARSVFRSGVPETAFLSVGFDRGTAANVQISWLAPSKVRQMVVVGSRRMVVYDDTSVDEPVRIFDRGIEMQTPASFGEFQLSYRSGDIVVPRLEPAEPLGLELADFAHAIRTGTEPRSNAQLGLEIVSVIEAAEESLRRCGQPVALVDAPARVAA